MKNRNITKLLLAPLFAFLLVGCKGGSTPSPSSEVPPSSEDPYGNYTQVNNGVYSNRALEDAIGMTALTSTGTQKLLVVPIVFSNTHSAATPENHEMLQKVFFGNSDDTGWESVASYYHKSSFGNLTLTGEVRDYFYVDWATDTFAKLPVSPTQEMGAGNYWDPTHHMIEKIYETLDAETLKAHDLDNDGHVDALWMIYMADIHATADDDTFWAYKFYWNRYANNEKPTPNVYAWASYQFAFRGLGYNILKPDAHTFIHETGHIFGLPDYYDYDKKTAPAGTLDMMDYNVGDHNIYSKFRLNWAKPYYVTGDSNITLKPSATNGEFILIKDNWNGHAYDEYLLLEYYTPTGLNEKDSLDTGYTEAGQQSGTKNYTASGVKIWHVDSRLLTYRYAENGEQLQSVGWNDKVEYDDLSFTEIGPSNTGSRSRVPNAAGTGYESSSTQKLLHLLNGTGRGGNTGNWLKTQSSATNEALFKTGQSIEADQYLKYFQYLETFNDTTSVGYSITIGEMTEQGVEIQIRKA